MTKTKRTQIGTGVSERTRAQADELIKQHGYSLRDVVSIAIDRMYQEERMTEKMRKLTQTEIDACPTDSSVNVALFHNGEWFYADHDGDVAILIEDEDGHYIPVIQAIDRVTQVNWINQLAAGLVDSSNGEGTADELVEETFSHPDFILPPWFDEHDRRLLVERVTASL